MIENKGMKFFAHEQQTTQLLEKIKTYLLITVTSLLWLSRGSVEAGFDSVYTGVSETDDTPPKVEFKYRLTSGEETKAVMATAGGVGISRTNAFIVSYDPKRRRFKLLPGEGTNIVYLNEEDLDGPTELKAGDVIELSDTKLRFIPFCGESFDWEDTE